MAWLPLTVNHARIHIETGTIDPVELGKLGGDLRSLIDHAGPSPEPLHFLQRYDVGAADRLDDAVQIKAVIFADPVVNVVGDKLQEPPSGLLLSASLARISRICDRLRTISPQSLYQPSRRIHFHGPNINRNAGPMLSIIG